MITTNFRRAAFALLALGAGLATSSAFAQDRYAVQSDAGIFGGQAVEEPVVEAEPNLAPPNIRGHLSCTFNEVRTRLERKNCAGVRHAY